jgi:hypothetical protein
MDATVAEEATNGAPWSRVVSGALGVWLFVSTYAWPHEGSEATNAIVCGAIAIDASIASLRTPVLQWLVAAVGVWLLLAPFVFADHGLVTIWNELFVGISLVALSMIPTSPWSWKRRAVAWSR